MAQETRVRFSFSAGSACHLGNVRIALLNYVYARQKKGKLIFRLDDIELEKGKKSLEPHIIDTLHWIGITWNEGPDLGGGYKPYRQSERITLYDEFIEKLRDEGKVYECFCTSGELEYARKQASRSGLSPKYNEKCKYLSDSEKNEYRKSGRKPVIRLKVQEKEISFDDLVMGHLSTDCSDLGDFVIIKADRSPMYNFASVIDDHLMKISMVIRSSDHLMNTYRQLMIFSQLDLKKPQFAHVPMLLNPDKSRLSKKFGSIAIHELQEMGYLPETVVHMLARACFSDSLKTEEIVTLDTFVKKYKIKEDTKDNLITERDKLNEINQMHLRRLSVEDLAERLKPFIHKIKFLDDRLMYTILSRIKNNLKRLDDVPRKLAFLTLSKVEYQKEYFQYFCYEDLLAIINGLEQAQTIFQKSSIWTSDTIQRTADSISVKGFDLARMEYALKIALTATPVDLPLVTILELLGRDVSLKRFEHALVFLRAERK